MVSAILGTHIRLKQQQRILKDTLRITVTVVILKNTYFSRLTISKLVAN